jgi:para-aminobenzoate synthetase
VHPRIFAADRRSCVAGPLRTLLIDNHDSNTFNLFQLLSAVEGREPVVIGNDEATLEGLDSGRFARCVISPGPGRADRPRDFGLSARALEQAELPVLGVCLGHQGLALAHGAAVGAAPAPMHGRRSAIFHDGTGLFSGIPQGFLAARYHSLAVAEPLPATLEVLARTASGTVMAVRHRERPHWGVQFHPESVATEWGARLIENFVELTRPARAIRAPLTRSPPRAPTVAPRRLELVTRSLPGPPDSESVFVALFATAANAFWLDSSRRDPLLGRFSYMGAAGGPLARLLSHDVAAGRLSEWRGERLTLRHTPLLDWLQRELASLSVAHAELPFGFIGGFVGYLGYELRAECASPLTRRSTIPDAQLLFADRLIAFDHAADVAHVVCLTSREGRAEAEDWVAGTERALRGVSPCAEPAVTDRGGATAFALARASEDYLRDIAAAQRHLAAGDSYELCLTNELRGPPCADALSLYRVLRRVNPAPFAAFLRLGGVEVCSSSPERFLSLRRDGALEARPIKGTVARGVTPGEDREAAARLRSAAKDRAENLMVVDVLRNDLGRVAEIGSVRVPSLMTVESYETVHQLVSVVTARLRAGATMIDALRATFPGGSMTGAPKQRAMTLLDGLEGRPRGVYSGAIGYLGVNGEADLSIAIRTIVNCAEAMTIGAGGAITTASDPAAELRELLLKARAPLEAVGLAAHGRRDGARLAAARSPSTGS